jgi:DNA-binding NarL/FixJ family response regulator
MENARILIVDDHRVVVEGIKSALADHPEFEVVGEALDGLQGVERVESLKPDIVIMDISMPHLDGIEATRKIREVAPDTRIIIFTMYSNKEFVVDLFKAGICAYVLKEDPMEDLILALKAVRGGGTYFSTKAPTLLVRRLEELEQRSNENDPYEGLSAREKEVFLLLAEGNGVKEIAWELSVSPKTAETHRYNIMQKLQAASIADLTRLAIRKDLIKP